MPKVWDIHFILKIWKTQAYCFFFPFFKTSFLCVAPASDARVLGLKALCHRRPAEDISIVKEEDIF